MYRKNIGVVLIPLGTVFIARELVNGQMRGYIGDEEIIEDPHQSGKIRHFASVEEAEKCGLIVKHIIDTHIAACPSFI